MLLRLKTFVFSVCHHHTVWNDSSLPHQRKVNVENILVVHFPMNSQWNFNCISMTVSQQTHWSTAATCCLFSSLSVRHAPKLQTLETAGGGKEVTSLHFYAGSFHLWGGKTLNEILVSWAVQLDSREEHANFTYDGPRKAGWKPETVWLHFYRADHYATLYIGYITKYHNIL